MTIQIVLADDRDLALIGAQTVLSRYTELQLVGTCQSLSDLLRLIAHTPPDVIVSADRLEPEMDVLSLVQRIQQAAPHTSLVIMGSLPDGLIIHELFHAGVLAYLYKYDQLEECLTEAIRLAARGKLYLSPTASAEYLLAVTSGQTVWKMDTEAREVLRLLAQGLRPQEIALQRRVPVRRVYNVCERLRRRFGAETNEHLIARAAEEGFL